MSEDFSEKNIRKKRSSVEGSRRSKFCNCGYSVCDSIRIAILTILCAATQP